MFKTKIQHQFKIVEARHYSYIPIPLENLSYETWRKAFKVKPRSLMQMWDIDDNQLQEKFGMHIDGLEEDEIQERFPKALERRVADYIRGYKFKKFPLTLYRAICVKTLEDIDMKKLGTDWTDEEKSAQCYHHHEAEEGSEIFVVKAVVKKTDVDWGSTLWNNLHPSFGDDENEVNLIPGKKIKIVEIQVPKEGWVDFKKPGVV